MYGRRRRRAVGTLHVLQLTCTQVARLAFQVMNRGQHNWSSTAASGTSSCVFNSSLIHALRARATCAPHMGACAGARAPRRRRHLALSSLEMPWAQRGRLAALNIQYDLAVIFT